MRRRIPLNAVRAFEAAARYQSLVKAADELCVTPTAVSHQIRLLEDFLQFKLFLRKGSRLELTPDARVCLERLTGAFDTIDDALKELKKPTQESNRLRIGASVSVASMWLLPRLPSFLQQWPDVDVSVTGYLNRHAVELDEPDLWISNGEPHMDRRIEPFLEEELTPVCSPIMAERYSGQPADALKYLPLIHNDRQGMLVQYPTWDRYLLEYGVRRDDVDKGSRFNQGGAAIEAAKSGLGAVLGRSILMEDTLAKGELIQIGDSYPIRSRYYLVSGWKNGSTAVERFRTWLFDQIDPRTIGSRHSA